IAVAGKIRTGRECLIHPFQELHMMGDRLACELRIEPAVDDVALVFGARLASRSVPLSNPTTGTAGCCARAVSGHAAAAPPSSVMKSRRFIALSPNPRIMGSIAGQGRASQQKRPAHVPSAHPIYEGPAAAEVMRCI